MVFRSVGWDCHDGEFQSTAYRLGDSADRHSLFPDGMIALPRLALLEDEPIEPGSVEPVNRWPAVKPFTDVSREAVLSACASR